MNMLSLSEIVELLIVGSVCQMQDEILGFTKYHNGWLPVTLSKEQDDLLDLGDRVITSAGFGPEDWIGYKEYLYN